MLRVARSSLRGDLPIASAAKVLDVGGGLRPHPRADVVIDIVARDSDDAERLGEASERERRTPAWVVHDICSSKPFPFFNNEFDFVICTHVLEDVRDPVRVCEELQRVGRSGYIETPSMESELTWRLEGRHHTGRWHHRWLVEASGEKLVFRLKPHFVNGFWQTRIPRRWWTSDPAADVLAVLWEESIACEEKVLHWDGSLSEIVSFVRERGVYPGYLYDLWGAAQAVRRVLGLLQQRRGR